METKVPIEKLVAKVLAEFKRLNYSCRYLARIKNFYKEVIAFAAEKNEKYFTEELGSEFLKEKYDCKTNIYTKEMSVTLKNHIRKIRILGDYQLHGVIVRRVVRRTRYIKPPQFEKVLAAYDIECQRRDYSKRGLYSKMNRLFFFIDFLDAKGIKDVSQITPQLLSDYVKVIYVNHEKNIAAILTAVRTFLKFLYLNEYTERDLSLDLPKQRNYYSPAIPSVWNPEDVKRMLQSIDRGNPAEKRDYAILLLVVRLGIRVSDIRTLKLCNLNWNTKTIEIQQNKTGSHVSYPILDDIGWALIDYLKNSRPNTDSQFVFLSLNVPHDPFADNANLNRIITKYTRRAGIKIPHGQKCGMHSLRHTLASTLLAQGTPLPVISAILGHLNSKSTYIYLQIGIDGLKKCALDPEEVFNHGE